MYASGNISKGNKSDQRLYLLQEIKANYFQKLNEKNYHQDFFDEIADKPAKRNYPTNKTIIKSIDDTWSAGLLNLVDYGVKNNRGYRYVLVFVDDFFKNMVGQFH